MLNIFRKRGKDPKDELRKLLGDYELPSFPAVVMNVLTALRDPDFSVNRIAAQLEADPGLHVKVLKTVNSAAFGLSTKVKNLHHAVALLGRSRLETIVLSQAVNRMLPKPELPFFSMRDFWLSSARRASLARVLAHRLHPATQVEAFTAGLLEDMALPILVTVKPKEYEKILGRWNTDREADLVELEREEVGFDHAVAGAMIAEEWHLPDYLIAAISAHHKYNPEIQLEPAVELASRIRCDSREDAVKVLAPLCGEKYGIPEETVAELVDTAFEDAEELSHMLR